MNLIKRAALTLLVSFSMVLISCSTKPTAVMPSSERPAPQVLSSAVPQVSSSALPRESFSPTPFKPVDAAELISVPAIQSIKGANISVYLREVSSGKFLKNPLGETLGDELAYCDMILLNRETNKAFTIGRFDITGENYGTFSVTGSSTLCYNNYKKLTFIDITKGENTGFSLDFKKPEEPNYRISSVAYDPQADEYAVLYNVSSYQGFRQWLTYDNTKLGATDAHIEFQRFRGDGSYFDTTVTDIEPYYMNEVASYQPNRYKDGKLSFLAKTYIAAYYAYDFNIKEMKRYPCDGVIPLGEGFILYQRGYNRQQEFSSFIYTFYENGSPTAVALVAKGEENIFNGDIGNAMYDISAVNYDPKAKMLIASCGNSATIFHRVNFLTGKGEFYYQYAPEQLTDKILSSANGRYEIYRIGYIEDADYLYCEDLAALDTHTGIASHIGLNTAEWKCVTNRGDFVEFYYNVIESLSLLSGKQSYPLEEFSSHNDPIEGNQVVIDMEYDAINSLFLLLCTAYFPPYTDKFPDGITTEDLYLRVYDENWNPLHTIDTHKKSVIDHDVYGPYSTGLELSGNGIALLDNGTYPVKYLER